MPEHSDDVTATNLAAWQAYAAEAGTESRRRELPSRMEWTQIPGSEPGAEILGDLRGRRILELGCGTGDNSAYLAAQGAHVTGIDGAPAQINRARHRWAHQPGVTFLHAEARVYLRQPGPDFDIVISVFGAIDWTPHEELLPLIANRLRPGGTLAFSASHPAWLSQVNSRLHLPSGRNVPVVRQVREPESWPDSLAAAELTLTSLRELAHNSGDIPHCLIVTASRERPTCGDSVVQRRLLIPTSRHTHKTLTPKFELVGPKFCEVQQHDRG